MGPNSPKPVSDDWELMVGCLTIPDRHVMLLHKFDLSVVHPSNVAFLFLCTLESADAVGEPKPAVIVDRVYGVFPDFVESCKVHTKAVAKCLSVCSNCTRVWESYVLPSRKRMWSGSIALIAGTMRS